ncbi:MAG TPA: PRC and DUF2382 domain-containing protein [Solirubrobacteraceae bacterium]|nr:PRC and DUF2382 domain-containing protein [Solirubrobacteraceae bacterium]
MASTHQDVLALRGQELYGSDGEKLGTIEEIYLDTESNEPAWALITTGLFATKQSFVPLGGMGQRGENATVPYDKETVKDAPKVDPDGRLSEREEEELYRHYGRDYGTSDTTGWTGSDRDDDVRDPNAVGHDVSGPTTDDATTRSEEELHVGKTEREAGRVRLRKYVVEDEVTQTVPVRREEVRVEREPITDANVGDATDGPAISEEEHEVVLHEEEPVSEKHAVPKERVRLDKDVHTEERQVSDTVRKEAIDVDDDARR